MESFMTTLHSPRRITWMAIAIVLLLHISPDLAASAGKDRDDDRGVVVTFTKWITGSAQPNANDQPAPTRSLMAGIVGGHVGTGTFVGEVLDHKLSTPGTVTVAINALEAIYEVHAGKRSFGALIRGGTSNGKGLLDGVILNGWRTGARVHVEFVRVASCPDNPNQTGPLAPCFQGTIRILPESEDSDE
jgi:hypothetical protein